MKASSGLANTGGVIWDHNGAWIVGFTAKIGTTNSFIAELWGLREGLNLVIHWGFNKIIAETDSNAMVQALERDVDDRPEADTIIMDCKFLMSQFLDCELLRVYREGNQCADYLANMGQNSQWGTSIFNLPPDGIKDMYILNRDTMSVASRRIY